MKIGRRKLAAVMFTDIVGYSALTHRDEDLAIRLVEEHRRLLRPIFAEFRGREIRTIGDAFFLEFASALDAVQCAIRVQRALHQRNEQATDAIMVRIGIHLGDVVETQDDGYDIYGDGVNIAARLQFLADPGGICFSRQVHDQVKAQIDEKPVPAGARRLKNISSPVEIFRITPVGTRGSEGSATLRAARRALWRGVRSRAAAFAGVAFIGALGAIALLGHREPAPDSGRLRIAVLPFSHLTGETSDEYLSEGLTDELITSLSRLPQLGVLARASVQPYRNSAKPLAEIGRELRAETILTGQVKRASGRLRVSVQLVDVRSQENLWAASFEVPVTEVFELHRKIAGQVIDQTRRRSLASVPGTTLPQAAPDQQAYLHYLKGRYFLNRRSEESLWKAFEEFKTAIGMDPAYAGHLVGASTSLHLLAYYGYISPKDALTRERPFTEKALKISQESAESLTARAGRRVYYDHDWSGGEADYRRALELQPSNSAARQFYGMLLLSQERFEEAAREFEAAIELDPLSPSLHVSRAFPDFFQKRYPAAIRQLKSALELDAGFLPAHLWIARALVLSGQPGQAIEILEKLRGHASGSPVIAGALGHAYAKAGREAEARNIISELSALSGKRYVSAYNIALIELGLGNRKAALKLLNQAFDERSVLLVDLRIDPFLDPLRADPRFAELRTAMNF